MLKDKTVVITGGGRGIGKALAMKFSSMGANIILNDLSVPPEQVIDEIRSMGGGCVAAAGDVSDFNKAREVISFAKETFSSVDVLINNAGITRDSLLIRMTEDDFDSVMNVNLKGAFNMTRHAAPVMIKQRSGVIINMSSIVGLRGNTGQANYSASKAGLIGLTKSTAKELAARGITCNAIAPGFIDTDMTAKLPDRTKEAYIESIPLKRLGNIDEVADAVVFLSVSKYITGQVLSLDGGLSI